VRLTERDLRLLSFLAEHRLALETHVAQLLGASPGQARARLRTLARGGFVSYGGVLDGEPAACRITRSGLGAVGSRLPAPRPNLACYHHDVGAAWLWLAAHRGGFGPIREVISERVLRSHDLSVDREDEPFGVRLGGVGPRGRERLHYPDLLLITPRGRRIAIELELTLKGRTRRESILGGYAADRRIDAVLYLVEKRSLRRALEASATRTGVADRVYVRYFRWGDRGRAGASGAGAQRGRPAPSRDRSHGQPAGAQASR
jgi:hypothetical protein